MQKLIERLSRLRWHQWLVVAAFILVLVFTGLHAFRAVRHAVYWSHHRDEPIHGWMSVGYVARSYHVPPRVLYDALGLQHTPHDRKPIRQIAHEQNRTVPAVIAVLENAIARARQPESPPPTAGPPGSTNNGRSP
ncbi:MAG TPA: hypothetical protein VN937_04175 [Blastocatellia bacterium]|nr:hypothetical protein [Blastocatellia bacterium]